MYTQECSSNPEKWRHEEDEEVKSNDESSLNQVKGDSCMKRHVTTRLFRS